MKSFVLKIAFVFLFSVSSLGLALLLDNDIAMNQIEEFIAKQDIDKSSERWKSNLTKPPQLSFQDNHHYYWHLVTNKGPIVIKLMTEYAPMHASSTIYLTKLGFYDGVVFHRVIPGFMAQGGDPLGTGRGGPGYTYDGEFHPEASHDDEGILSMANSGPGTDGSQFFITFKQTRFLDGRHTVFGKVVNGIDTLKIIEKLGSQSGRTQEDLVILTASISNQP